MKKILLHLEGDAKASSFDQITAYDAGVDHIIAYGGVKADEVPNLVYGAMFTRGGDDLRHSAIFIGGTQVAEAEKLLAQTLKTFFGPVRVSVMFDANGCNTTAAALVRKILSGRDLRGQRALVLAGTGPVGTRAATLLAQEGCQVALSSRQLDRAQQVCQYLQQQFSIQVEPVQIAASADLRPALDQAAVLVACGSPGIRLAPQADWTAAATLQVVADINAVEPLGIEGIKVADDGKDRFGKAVYGAIAIGGLKMKIHRAAIKALFTRNDLVMDLEAIYALAKEISA